MMVQHSEKSSAAGFTSPSRATEGWDVRVEEQPRSRLLKDNPSDVRVVSRHHADLAEFLVWAPAQTQLYTEPLISCRSSG
jgi:hypothetical protein